MIETPKITEELLASYFRDWPKKKMIVDVIRKSTEISQVHLAEVLGIKEGTLFHHIEELRVNGIVYFSYQRDNSETERDSQRRVRKMIELTDEAREILERRKSKGKMI